VQEGHAQNANAGADAPSAPAGVAEPTQAAKREISSIQFPYGDLDDAVSFAKAIYAVGGQGCLIEQLAGFLKVAPSGGAFRSRMAHPRIFGLVEYERGAVKLSDLGRRIVDATQEDSAKVDAFLTVPLYRAIYDRYKGYTLPPPAALEREMASLGVSSKQTDKARQVFERSARQAGFYWAGNERLTLPVTKSRPETKPLDQFDPSPAPILGGGSGSGELSHLDPLIIELLKKIPSTADGWPEKPRLRWFKTFAMNVSQIYDADELSTVDLEIRINKDLDN
jgi:hypothetical protein